MKKVLPVVILISMLLTLLSGCSASGNLKGGDNIDDLLMPPDAVHGVVCLEAGKLVDVFTPMREDFV